MRIDINFQNTAQKLKYKAISNSLRKGKTNSTCVAHHHADEAHMHVWCACAHVAHAHRPARGVRQPAHWRFCRDAPALPSIHIALLTLFLYTATLQEHPRNLPPLQWYGPRPSLHAPARRAVALAHASATWDPHWPIYEADADLGFGVKWWVVAAWTETQ